MLHEARLYEMAEIMLVDGDARRVAHRSDGVGC